MHGSLNRMRTREAPVATVINTALARFAAELRHRFGEAVVDVRLFGSFARSEAGEESDVDVAVVLEGADWSTRREVIDLATDAGLPFDLLISPTIFDRETYQRWREQERPLVMDIERDGVPL
jgi:predicted nucleotidyltransferase